MFSAIMVSCRITNCTCLFIAVYCKTTGFFFVNSFVRRTCIDPGVVLSFFFFLDNC